MTQFGAWAIGEDDVPRRLSADRAFLEKHFENWVESDPSLLGGDVRWVARQLPVPGYRLDLFGVTMEGTWVIAELKPGPVGAGTVLQALGYFLEMATMPNRELVRRIREHGVVDEAVIPYLAKLDEEPEQCARDYLLLVAGFGAGESATTTADTLFEHGFDIPVKVVTFELARDDAGRRFLVRTVEDDTRRQPTDSGPKWTLESLRERATECGVRDGFDRICDELDTRGFSTRVRQYGLNFNLSSRFQCLWVTPTPGRIHVSYLPTNFQSLFGIDETIAKEVLGENELELAPEQAHAQIAIWADRIIALRDKQQREAETVHGA